MGRAATLARRPTYHAANTGEGVSVGTAPTVANTGGTSGQPLDFIGNYTISSGGTLATPVIDNGKVLYGTRSFLCGQGSYLEWRDKTFGPKLRLYARVFFCYPTANPTGGGTAHATSFPPPGGADAVLGFYGNPNYNSSGTDQIVRISVNGSGKIQGAVNGSSQGPGTYTLSGDAWYRMEAWADLATGTWQAQVFDPDSATPLDTVSGPLTGVTWPSIRKSIVGPDWYVWIKNFATSSRPDIFGPQLAPAGATVPGAPTLNSATVSSGNVTLAWSHGTAGSLAATTGAKIYRRISGGGAYTLIKTLTQPATSWLDVTGAATTTYDYVMSETNAAGESAQSGSQTVTIPAVSPQFVSAAAGSGTITAPTGGQAGDLLVFIAYGESTTTPPTTPTGFTSVATWISGSSAAGAWRVATRTVTSSEPANFGTFAATGAARYVIMRYQHASGIDTTVGLVGTSYTSSTSTPASPSVTPSATGEMLVCAVGTSGGRTPASAPSGMSDLNGTALTGTVSIWAADELLSSTSATGTQTWGTLNTASTCGAVSFLVVA